MRQVVDPWPQMLQGEPDAKTGTPLLIILSLVCKSDIKEANSVSSNPLLKKECPWVETSKAGGKNVETVSQTLIISGIQ